MQPADVLALVPYFARVARRLARGPDAEDSQMRREALTVFVVAMAATWALLTLGGWAAGAAREILK